MRKVAFKLNYWSYEETQKADGQEALYIIVTGRTPKGESVTCRIDDFPVAVYLELPKRSKYKRGMKNGRKKGGKKSKGNKVIWNKKKCKYLYNYFCETNKFQAPFKYKMVKQDNLYRKETMLCLKLFFRTEKATKIFAGNLRKKQFHIPSVGSFDKGELKLHEENIDPVIKFTAVKDILPTGWVEVTETILEDEQNLNEDERKFSYSDIDFYAKWSNVVSLKDKTHTSTGVEIPESVALKYLAFDLETYSKNHNSKQPDPEPKANVIFQNAIEIGELYGESRVILCSLGKHNPVDGVENRFYKKERDLILDFVKIINEFQPDIFIHYNGMGFDWQYIMKRAEVLGIYTKFMKFSRILGEKAKLRTTTWQSSAYGKQTLTFPDPVGVVNLDACIEVQRNQSKLKNYKLKTVTEEFIGETKDPISYRQLWILYQLTIETKKYMGESHKITDDDLTEIKVLVRKIMDKRFADGPVKKLRRKLLRSKKSTVKQYLLRPLFLTGKYNVQDTRITRKLVETLNMDQTMEATSNVCGIPMSYLHTRGQLVRVVALLYRYTSFRNIVIPTVDKNKEYIDYQGATVFNAIPGFHKLVGCLDFASLYPSITRALNICWTTNKDNDPKFPDERTFVREWEDHVRCPHDPKKRKPNKNNKTLCYKHRYRWERPVYHPDGSITGEGLLPEIIRKLLGTRKLIKKDMNRANATIRMHKGEVSSDDVKNFKKWGYTIIEEGSLTPEEYKKVVIQHTKFNAQQLAVKVTANSTYGCLGAKKGPIPNIEGAASVTQQGRELIQETVNKITSTYKEAENVYGDSVTGDTPILCRMDGNVFYRTIDNLPKSDEYCLAPENEKEYAIPKKGLEVWSDKGWTKVKGIMRHYTKKKIYRVLTHTGVVDVTEDHSLLDLNGDEIKPNEVSVGDILLHKDLPTRVMVFIKNRKIKKCAYALGLFYGDGSCGAYDCPSGFKRSWAINNQNLDFLNKAKECLEDAYPKYTFKILDTMKSSGVYKLVACGDVKKLVTTWRKLFYHEKYKKVPDFILNSEKSIIQQFYDGYYDADGDKDKNGYLRFDNKGKIGSAGLYLISNILGYPVSINTRSDKDQIYRMTLSRTKQRKNPNIIKKITDLGETEDFVYDIETENHHFSAGVGRLVVHNTDSTMVRFIGKSPQESWDLSIEAAEVATHYLICMILGFEEETTFDVDGVKKRIDKISKEEIKYLKDKEKCMVYAYIDCPILLEFENMYGEFFQLTKKRYRAIRYDRDGNKVGKTIEKGIILKRRDNCDFARNCYRDMFVSAMENRLGKEFVINLLYDWVHKLFTRRVPDTDLIVYIGVKDIFEYAKKKIQKKPFDKRSNPYLDHSGKEFTDPYGVNDPRLKFSNIPQTLLALKIIRRGTKLATNTRLEFVYLENEDDLYTSGGVGPKAEDYTYYIENRKILDLRPDRFVYLENKLMRPVMEFLTVEFIIEKIPYKGKIEDRFKAEINNLKNELISYRINANKKTEDKVNYIIGIPTSIERKKRDFDFKEWCETKKETGPAKNTVKKGSDIYQTALHYKSYLILTKLNRQYGIKKRPSRRPDGRGNDFYIRDSQLAKTIINARKNYRRVVNQLFDLFSPVVFCE